MFSGVRNKSLQMLLELIAKIFAMLESQKTNHTDTCVCHSDTATDTEKSKYFLQTNNLKHLEKAEDLNT